MAPDGTKGTGGRTPFSSLQSLTVMQPTFVSVDQELLRAAIVAAENAMEFGIEVLDAHIDKTSNDSKRHQQQSVYLEQQIQQAKTTMVKLREALGWPQKEGS